MLLDGGKADHEGGPDADDADGCEDDYAEKPASELGS